MSPGPRIETKHSRLLVSLTLRRLKAGVRHPTLSFILGAVLPALVLLTALLTLGRVGVPSIDDFGGGSTLGVLVAGSISFLAYGALFGGFDNLFLRHLGIDGRGFFLERSLRLTLIGAAVTFGAIVPFIAAGEPIFRPFVVASTSAAVTVAGSVLMNVLAARSMTLKRRTLLAMLVPWDVELARAAPLVYAPVPTFLAGAVAGGITAAASPEGAAAAPLVAISMAAAAILVSSHVFAPILGSFLPQTREMAQEPPPEGGGETFRVKAGLSSLLPRRAAAIWVRDGSVALRRFPWAGRITWPVVAATAVALARWGESESTRVWVLAAVGLALAVQFSAVVALGLVERRGPRWIDRSVGVSGWERWLGRWAWSWGLGLWLLIPVALTWWWWSGVQGAWIWIAAGALTSAFASMVSLLNAQRR